MPMDFYDQLRTTKGTEMSKMLSNMPRGQILQHGNYPSVHDKYTHIMNRQLNNTSDIRKYKLFLKMQKKSTIEHETVNL